MAIRDKYLQLLRSSINPQSSTRKVEENAVSFTTAELQELLWLSQIHGTGPLIYNELLKGHGKESLSGEGRVKLPSAMAMQMKQVCLQNMLLQEQWEQIIEKVWRALDGVHAVLMKGFVYARLYPLPYLRSWGDLDVWVGPEQYHQACALLRNAFPKAKHHDEEWDELKHYCFILPNGMAIELHRVSMDFLSPADQAYWNELEKEAGKSADVMRIGGADVPLFEPKFDLLFCFMHSWEHFSGTGIPLKQVCDMTLLVQSVYHHSSLSTQDIDAYLEQHLRALKLLEVWRTYGYMACKMMGLSHEEWPLLIVKGQRVVNRDVATYGERLYEQVMTEGQCRKKDYGEAGDRYEARANARKMNVVARKWLTLRGRIEKAVFLGRFAPRYARYVLWLEIKKGIRRTIRREQMIDY